MYSLPIILKMCHPPKEFDLLTINWWFKYWLLVRVKWEYTYVVWYNILHFIVHIEIIVILVTSINKCNILLSLQNLKMLILFIFILWTILFQSSFSLPEMLNSPVLLTPLPFSIPLYHMPIFGKSNFQGEGRKLCKTYFKPLNSC